MAIYTEMNSTFWVFTVFFLINFIYSLTTCGIIRSNVAPSYPFFVRVELIKQVLYRTYLTKFCGGTVIASDIIVTAAHCLYLFDEKKCASLKEIQVVKSDFRLFWKEIADVFRVKKYVNHDMYNPEVNYGVGPYDVALIKLDGNLDLSDPLNAVLEPCPYSDGYAR